MLHLFTRNLDAGITDAGKERTLIHDLSLDGIDDSLVIVGPSGCGKSTLLKTLAGLLPALNGTAGFAASEKGSQLIQSDNLKKAYVWQELALMPWKRVYDSLRLALKITDPQISSKIRDERIDSILSELELSDLKKRFPHELSGGQRQRLALGQALIIRPQVLFLDEPFSALDAMLKEKLQDSLKKLLQKRQCLMVMVTHDLQEAVYLGKHILLLGPHGSKRHSLIRNAAYQSVADDSLRESELFSKEVAQLHQRMRCGQMEYYHD